MGAFTNASNWTATSGSPGFPPGARDEAIINSGTSILFPADPSQTLSALTLGSMGFPTASLAVNGTTLTVGNSSGGGILTNGGVLNVYDGGTLTLLNTSAGNATISNSGSINLGFNASDHSTLSFNGAGATFDLGNGGTGSVTLSDNAGNLIKGVTGMESLINDGGHTIQGTGTIENLASFTNNGALNSNAGGTLIVDTSAHLGNWNSGTLTNGYYSASNGSVLQLSSIGAGSIQTLAGAQISLSGTGIISGDGTTNALLGLANLDDASIALSGASSFTPTGGILTLTGSQFTAGSGSGVTINGSYSQDFNSALKLQNGSTFTATGLFANTGTVNLTGEAMMFSTAPGMAHPTSAGPMGSPTEVEVTSGDFTNSAAGMVTIGDNTSLLIENGNYTQTGGTTALAGTLTVSTSTDAVNIDGGTLTGGGTVEGSLTVDSGGMVNPGGDPSPTTLTLTGNYTQSALGIMDLDVVSSTSYDSLNVTGEAILNGTLEISLDPGFTAADGTYLDIVNWGTESGNFNYFNAPVFYSASYGWQTFAEVFGAGTTGLGLSSDALYLEVVSTQPAPEPSTFGMLVCSMLLGAGVSWRVRRRRTVIT